VLTCAVPEASATFPGSNGKIAFVGFYMPGCNGICTIDPDGTHLKQLGAVGYEPSWSADGRQIVFYTGGASGAIYTMRANGTDQRQIPGVGGYIESASFSPDGRRVLYAANGAIRTIRTDGTDRRLVFRGKAFNAMDCTPYPDAPEYSPSGKRIVFVGKPLGKPAGIWTVRPDGTRLRNITKDPVRSLIDPYADAQPDWSPGGGRIAFFRFNYDDGRQCFGQTMVIHWDGSGIYSTGRGTPYRYAPSGGRLVSWTGESDDTNENGVCDDIITFETAGNDVRTVTHNCEDFHNGEPSAFARQPSWQPLPGG
jgi:dipeptidyl aminopeptidase/acylaminoacyl peptidase